MPNHAPAGLAPRSTLETRPNTLPSRREKEMLVVDAPDSRLGIAPEPLAHIFNPFDPTRLRGVGTGFGLPSADDVVPEHAGSLRVPSDLGRGARFEVVLPLVTPPAIPS